MQKGLDIVNARIVNQLEHCTMILSKYNHHVVLVNNSQKQYKDITIYFFVKGVLYSVYSVNKCVTKKITKTYKKMVRC